MSKIDPIRTKDSSDKVFNQIANKYHEYIPENYDILYSELASAIDGYYLDKNSIEELKELIKQSCDPSLFDKEIPQELVDFQDEPENNYRLSLLLPRIIRLRQKIYKLAYYIASNIITGEITDSTVQEDFNLGINIIRNNPLENFYADLTVYLSDESVERFYAEMNLLDVVTSLIERKPITEKQFANLEQNLDKKHQKELDYIKSRFLPRILRKEDNHDDN